MYGQNPNKYYINDNILSYELFFSFLFFCDVKFRIYTCRQALKKTYIFNVRESFTFDNIEKCSYTQGVATFSYCSFIQLLALLKTMLSKVV